jgi:hypothetical protein
MVKNISGGVGGTKPPTVLRDHAATIAPTNQIEE